MTPQEKAEELVRKYYTSAQLFSWYECKQCALIAVDEILKAVEGKYDEYWKEVKKEIEKL